MHTHALSCILMHSHILPCTLMRSHAFSCTPIDSQALELCACSLLLLEIAVEVMFSSFLSRLHRAMAEPSGPYTKGHGKSSTSKGKVEQFLQGLGPVMGASKGNFEFGPVKGGKSSISRASRAPSFEAFEQPGKGTRGFMCKWSIGPVMGAPRPEFEKMGAKGKLLSELWDIAEEGEDEEDSFEDQVPAGIDPTKNFIQLTKYFEQRSKSRQERAHRIIEQLREMENQHEARSSTSSSSSTRHAASSSSSDSEYVPGEFLELLPSS